MSSRLFFFLESFSKNFRRRSMVVSSLGLSAVGRQRETRKEDHKRSTSSPSGGAILFQRQSTENDRHLLSPSEHGLLVLRYFGKCSDTEALSQRQQRTLNGTATRLHGGRRVNEGRVQKRAKTVHIKKHGMAEAGIENVAAALKKAKECIFRVSVERLPGEQR